MKIVKPPRQQVATPPIWRGIKGVLRTDVAKGKGLPSLLRKTERCSLKKISPQDTITCHL